MLANGDKVLTVEDLHFYKDDARYLSDCFQLLIYMTLWPTVCFFPLWAHGKWTWQRRWHTGKVPIIFVWKATLPCTFSQTMINMFLIHNAIKLFYITRRKDAPSSHFIAKSLSYPQLGNVRDGHCKDSCLAVLRSSFCYDFLWDYRKTHWSWHSCHAGLMFINARLSVSSGLSNQNRRCFLMLLQSQLKYSNADICRIWNDQSKECPYSFWHKKQCVWRQSDTV